MGMMQLMGSVSTVAPPINVGDIGNSLRFRAASSARLSKTLVAGDRKKWTFSTWIKRGLLGTTQGVFSAGNSTANSDTLRFEVTTDKLRLYFLNATAGDLSSSQVFRDPSAHLHLVLAYDSMQAVAADRVKLYVNGVALILTGTYPSLSQDSLISSLIAHTIGAQSVTAAANFFDGYLSRVAFVDGQALPPSSFGLFNEVGQWVSKTQPQVKAVVDAGGLNSFMLDFTDGATVAALGNDLSTKNNDWTPTNISITAGADYDWMLDTPSNNYATLDPVALPITTGSLIYANLRPGSPSVATHNRWRTTIAASSGKWYFEGTPVTINAATSQIGIIGTEDANGATYLGASAGGYVYASNGQKGNNAVFAAYGVSYVANNVIGVAVDLDAGTLEFFKNGASQGIAYSGLVGTFHFGVSAIGSGSATSTWNVNFGQRPFVYTPPADFLPLNTANMDGAGTVTVSGTFTGNANANGPFVWMNGAPDTLTINGNAVTFGTHADKTAGGFKLRTASVTYNAAGANSWVATITSDVKNLFKYRNASP